MTTSEPVTQLYLAVNKPFLMQTETSCFEAIIRRFRPAALLIDLKEEGQLEAQINAISDICVRQNVALMLANKPYEAKRLNCDGVHISDPTADIAQIRASLPPGFQIGVSCGRSRDVALTSGESGAHYVSVDADEPLLAEWWIEMTELPLVLEKIESAEQASAARAIGVDFLLMPLDFSAPTDALATQITSWGFEDQSHSG